jgi:hypothetical protein
VFEIYTGVWYRTYGTCDPGPTRSRRLLSQTSSGRGIRRVLHHAARMKSS